MLKVLFLYIPFLILRRKLETVIGLVFVKSFTSNSPLEVIKVICLILLEQSKLNFEQKYFESFLFGYWQLLNEKKDNIKIRSLRYKFLII